MPVTIAPSDLEPVTEPRQASLRIDSDDLEPVTLPQAQGITIPAQDLVPLSGTDAVKQQRLLAASKGAAQPAPIAPDDLEVITPAELGQSYPEVTTLEHMSRVAARYEGGRPTLGGQMVPAPGPVNPFASQAPGAGMTMVGAGTGDVITASAPQGPKPLPWRQEISNAMERGGLRTLASGPGTLSATMKIGSQMPGGWYPHTPEVQQDIQQSAANLDKVARTIYEDSLRQEVQPTRKGALGYIANTTFETLPLMAASTVAGLTTGPAGAFAVGAMAEGEAAYQNAIQKGATEDQAQTERLIVGTINGVIERAQVDEILSLGKGVGKDALRQLVQSAREKAWGKLAKQGAKLELKHIGKAANEGLEEALQESVSIGAATIHGEKIEIGPAVGRVGGAALGGFTAGYGLTGAAGAVEAITPEAPAVSPQPRTLAEAERKPAEEARMAQAVQQQPAASATLAEMAAGRPQEAAKVPSPAPVTPQTTVGGVAQPPSRAQAAFTTAQGSSYTWDGTRTQRTKSLHPGHAPTDVGLKAPSERTVFVDPEAAREIGMHNTLNAEAQPKVAIEGDKVVLTSRFGKGWKKVSSKEYPFSTEPKVGLSPVEFWPDGTNHPGNPITEIRGSLPTEQPAPSAATGNAPSAPVQQGPGGTAPGVTEPPLTREEIQAVQRITNQGFERTKAMNPAEARRLIQEAKRGQAQAPAQPSAAAPEVRGKGQAPVAPDVTEVAPGPAEEEVMREPAAAVATGAAKVAEGGEIGEKSARFDLEQWIKERAKQYPNEVDYDHQLKRVSEDIRNGKAPADIIDKAMRLLPRTLDRETGEILDNTNEDWPRTGTLLDFIEGQEQERMPPSPAPAAPQRQAWEVSREEAVKSWKATRVSDVYNVSNEQGFISQESDLPSHRISKKEAIESAHRYAIRDAVQAGKPVPTPVLQEYASEAWAKEELARRAGAATISSVAEEKGVGPGQKPPTPQGPGETTAKEDWQLSQSDYYNKHTHWRDRDRAIRTKLRYNPPMEDADYQAFIEKSGGKIISVTPVRELFTPAEPGEPLRDVETFFGADFDQMEEVVYEKDGQKRYAYILNSRADVDTFGQESFTSDRPLGKGAYMEMLRRRKEWEAFLKETQPAAKPKPYPEVVHEALRAGKPVSFDQILDWTSSMGAHETLDALAEGVRNGYPLTREQFERIKKRFRGSYEGSMRQGLGEKNYAQAVAALADIEKTLASGETKRDESQELWDQFLTEGEDLLSQKDPGESLAQFQDRIREWAKDTPLEALFVEPGEEWKIDPELREQAEQMIEDAARKAAKEARAADTIPWADVPRDLSVASVKARAHMGDGPTDFSVLGFTTGKQTKYGYFHQGQRVYLESSDNMAYMMKTLGDRVRVHATQEEAWEAAGSKVPGGRFVATTELERLPITETGYYAVVTGNAVSAQNFFEQEGYEKASAGSPTFVYVRPATSEELASFEPSPRSQGAGPSAMRPGFAGLGAPAGMAGANVPPVILDAADLREPLPEVRGKEYPKDISPKQQYLNSLQHAAYLSKHQGIQRIADDLIDTPLVMRETLQRLLMEGRAQYKKLPKEYRRHQGAKFMELMDEHYSPEEIDAATEIPETVKPILQWFKRAEEDVRLDIVRRKRETMKAVHAHQDTATLVGLGQKAGLSWEARERTVGGLQTQSVYDTEAETFLNKGKAAEELAKLEVKDTWGRQWEHIQHIYFGQYKLKVIDPEGNEHFIGAAETQGEAADKLMTWKEHAREDGLDLKDWQLTFDRDFHLPYDMTRLPTKQVQALKQSLTEALNAERKDVDEAMRGHVGTKAGKQKFWGALEHRKGAAGYSTDFLRVWQASASQYLRWKHLTDMNARVTPAIEALRSEGLPGWAANLEDWRDTLMGRKRSLAAQWLDDRLARVPGLRLYVKPYMVERWTGRIKGFNYLRHLQTVRFYVVNSLQLAQTLWPVVGERDFYRGVKLYYSREGKAILGKYGVATEGKFKETGTVAAKKTRGWSPASWSERRNQGVAFLTLYQHARRLGMSEAEAARYGRLRGQVFTQFAHSPADVPKFMRGNLTGLIFQYKRFTVKNLELVARLAREGNYGGIARWLGALVSIGGLSVFLRLVTGLPMVGYLSYQAYKWIEKHWGKLWADMIHHGLPALLGVDVSGSVTPIDVPYGRTFSEKVGNVVLGPTGQTVHRLVGDLTNTDVAQDKGLLPRTLRSLVDSSPTAKQFESLLKALNKDTSNLDAKGREAYKFEVGDLWTKALGFVPEAQSLQRQQMEAMLSLKTAYDERLDKVALARIGGDKEAAARLIVQWNGLFPEAAMTIKDSDGRVEGRTKAAGQTKDVRTFQSLPRDLKAAFPESLENLSDTDLRSLLKANTYQAYSRPGRDTNWRVRLPGQAKDGSQALVKQIRTELSRRRTEKQE